MKQEALPDGYAITQLSDGRFYPLRVSWKPYTDIYPLSWEAQRVPFAYGPRSASGIVSFADRKLAVQYCHRQHEESPLLREMAQTLQEREVYPERNVWYQEEIQRLVQEYDPYSSWKNNGIRIVRRGTRMEGVVSCFVRGTFQTIHVQGDTFDEAIAALYHEVYARVMSVSPLLQEKGA